MSSGMIIQKGKYRSKVKRCLYKIWWGSLVVISINEWTGHQPQEIQLLVFIMTRCHSSQVKAKKVDHVNIGGCLRD